MSKDDFFQIGFILKEHGLKGEVKARLTVQSPEEYLKLESVFVEINKKPVPFFIEHMTINKAGQAIIKFEDVTFDRASKIGGCALSVPVSSLKKNDKTKLKDQRIIGFKITDVTVGEIGFVESILEYPMQLLLQTTYHEREVLIPCVENVVLNVDLKKKTIEVDLPPGLLELNA
jgi:16S rRNA processing protein RimM